MSEISFFHFASRERNSLAVVDPQCKAWTRGSLADLAHRAARASRAAGLRPGDALGILAPNCAEYLAIYLGGIEAGLCVVPLNWHLADDELAFVLEEAGVRALFAHARLGVISAVASRVLEPGAVRVSIGHLPGFTPLEDFTACQAPEPMPGPRGRVMPFTSATTGRPKAVILPDRNADAARAKTIAWHRSLGIEPQDANVHLCASMLYHSAPLEGAVTALEMGHAVVLVDRPQPETLLERIDRYRVTTSFMVPAMFVRLLKLPSRVRRRYSTASLRFVVHGGAPCPVEVKRRMLEWWGPIIWESYGAAEGQGAIVDAANWLRRPGTVGRPIPGCRIKILDGAGRELPAGEVGFVYLEPHTGDRFEYKGKPEATRASYRGSFITVGDLGYLDDEGFLFLRDRRADLIISSGMNIYPAEIEQVLLEHPAVADCGVCGEPHELFGEVPKAVVQPAEGVVPGPPLTAELLQFLAEKLSPMKLPKRFEYTNELPRDPTGKLRRRYLRGPRSGNTLPQQENGYGRRDR
ncbi:MAG TPA: AMP-binding protein [Gammaproteobacteria bacterium]|nr:AMP-binding protein [Gammaproteobacteria bacterium]